MKLPLMTQCKIWNRAKCRVKLPLMTYEFWWYKYTCRKSHQKSPPAPHKSNGYPCNQGLEMSLIQEKLTLKNTKFSLTTLRNIASLSDHSDWRRTTMACIQRSDKLRNQQWGKRRASTPSKEQNPSSQSQAKISSETTAPEPANL